MIADKKHLDRKYIAAIGRTEPGTEVIWLKAGRGNTFRSKSSGIGREDFCAPIYDNDQLKHSRLDSPGYFNAEQTTPSSNQAATAKYQNPKENF